MDRQQAQGPNLSDDETFQAWENMRVEILHELQEGASADIPDSDLDDIGILVVILTAWRDQRRPFNLATFKFPTNELASSVN